MATGYGYGPESWISVAEETVWGTFKATGQKYCRIHGESMKCDRGIKAVTSVLSGNAGNNRIVAGFEKVGGAVQPECLWEGGNLLFLKHLFGTVATTPVGTGAYSHVFSFATALPVGLSLEVSKGNVPDTKVNTYSGCKVSQGVFTWAAEDLWRQAFTLVGKEEIVAATRLGAPTWAVDEPVYWWYASTFTFAGTSSVKIKSGSLTINNAIDDSHFLFSKTISEPHRNGKRTVTGSFVLELNDWTLYNLYKLDTEGAFTASFTSPNDIPGSSPLVKYIWSMTGTKCRITGETPVVNSEGIIEWPLNFVMRAPTTGNDELTMTVQNGQATIT